MDCHDDDLNLPPGGFYAADYAMLLHQICEQGVVEFNQRTKSRVKILPGGTAMRIDLQHGLLPMLAGRKLYPRTAAAEIAWFLRGTQDPAFIQEYSFIWDKFIKDGKLENAYGYRWRSHFGRDQIADAIKLLTENPSDRQVMVCAWDPRIDGMDKAALNIPCPTHFTLNIVDGLLHSSYFLRSSDFFVGFPYDIMCHAFLMRGIASELDVELGSLFVTMSHVHLYEAHWHQAEKYLNQEPVYPLFSMQPWALEYLSSRQFVEEVTAISSRLTHPKYNPKPEIVA